MKKLLILPILLICAPFLVNAQEYDYEDNDGATIENAFGIGPRAGYYMAEDADDGTFYYGLQMRARMGEVVGLEGSVTYRPGTESSFVNADGVEQDFETKFVPVTGSLMLFLPLEASIAPYGLGGVGAYYTIYEADGDFVDDWDSEFNFGYHAGFGLELPMSSNAALNIDYRYLFLTPENENTPEDADYSGSAFTASLMFYF